MLAVEEALERILRAFAPLPTEVVPLTAALGRTLAEPLRSRVTQPPFDVSAMDGYALRAADVRPEGASLAVVGEQAAGSEAGAPLQEGEAARIFTGGLLPPGADTVVIQEDVERQGGLVRLRGPVVPGSHVRPAGLDFHAGEELLQAGRKLTATDVGLAAAMDRPWLRVRRKPRIALLATGDEIVLPGEPRRPSQIVSSNGFALAALLEGFGALPINLGIAPDRREALEAMMRSAADCDLLITLGGASVGDHDLVRQVLGSEDFAIDFWKIAMRPGKPLIFGRLGATPLLGFPGNPVSSVVCALLFARPAVWRLLGRGTEVVTQHAILGEDLGENDRRQDYLRAKLRPGPQGLPEATAFPRQDSSMLATLAAADCLIVRAPFAPPARRGETVEILPLGEPPFGN